MMRSPSSHNSTSLQGIKMRSPCDMSQIPIGLPGISAAADATVTVDHTLASARQLTHDLLCGVIQLAPTLIPTLILPDDAIEFRRRLLDIDVHLDLALFHFGFNVKQVALQRLIHTH